MLSQCTTASALVMPYMGWLYSGDAVGKINATDFQWSHFLVQPKLNYISWAKYWYKCITNNSTLISLSFSVINIGYTCAVGSPVVQFSFLLTCLNP